MAITPSKLRQNVYRILDEVIETGRPVEVLRKGKVVRLVPAEPPPDKLAKLTKHPGAIVGDPEDLVRLGWLDYCDWDPDKNLNP
jgi:antitoxin (DNA-binding transcriptional repressor) of toxin-antitoxin stability system